MEPDNNIPPQPQPNLADTFGMTEEDLKNQKVKNFFATAKYYFQKIEPAVVKVLNVTIYYLIKFVKAFVSSAFQMIKGGGS